MASVRPFRNFSKMNVESNITVFNQVILHCLLVSFTPPPVWWCLLGCIQDVPGNHPECDQLEPSGR